MELAAANAALALLEIVIPKIAALVKSGQVTPEEQQTVLDRVHALKTDPSKFTGPEWEPSGR